MNFYRDLYLWATGECLSTATEFLFQASGSITTSVERTSVGAYSASRSSKPQESRAERGSHTKTWPERDRELL
jgi:hypothetical protein